MLGPFVGKPHRFVRLAERTVRLSNRISFRNPQVLVILLLSEKYAIFQDRY